MEWWREIIKESDDPSRRKTLQGIEEEQEEEKKLGLLEHPEVKPIIEALKKIPEYTSLGFECLRSHPKYTDIWKKGRILAVGIVATFVLLAVLDFILARWFIIIPMSFALISLAYLSGIGIFVTYFTILQAIMAFKSENIKKKLEEEGITYEELLERRISKGFKIKYYGFLVIAGAVLGLVTLLRHSLPPIYPVIPGFLHGILSTLYVIIVILIRIIAAGSFLLFVYVVPAILGQVRPFAYRETLKERLGMRVQEWKRGISRRRKKVRKRWIDLLQEDIKDLKTSLIYARFRMAIDYLPYLGMSAVLFPPSAMASSRVKWRIMYDPYPLDELERGLLVFIPISIFIILVLTTPLGVWRIFLSPVFNLAYGFGILKGVKLFEDVINNVRKEKSDGSKE